MITPNELKKIYKANKSTLLYIKESRETISNIIKGNENKLLVIVGPCSIHNAVEGLEYAKELVKIKEKYKHLFIVMRTYFEKPRTTIGWKGLINDPDLNGSFNIEKGIQKARKFLLDINGIGLATATEFLDNMTHTYISDLISYGAIGARTTESQLHREMASGLPMPVGFKNSTNGAIDIATDAIVSSNSSHSFLGINQDGEIQISNTKGNPNTHIILRGGKGITNYDKNSVNETENSLNENNIKTGILVDFSHANSKKDHNNQKIVCSNISSQITNGNKVIVGVMIESNINSGNQSFTPGKDNIQGLQKGISITDGCSSLSDTEKMLHELNIAVSKRNKKFT